MSDVFISYSSQDRIRAKLVAEALRGKGFSVWWDRELLPGQTFPQILSDRIRKARCLIVLCSQSSSASKWVGGETQEAQSRQIPVIPVLIGISDLPLDLKTTHAASLVGWAGDTSDPEFESLVKAVTKHVGSPRGTPSAGAGGGGAKQRLERARALLVGEAQNLGTLESVLKDDKTCSFDDVECLRAASQVELKKHIHKFFSRGGEDDLLLLYCSGSIETSRTAGLHLCTSDTEPGEMLEATAIPLSWVNSVINGKARTNKIILILDGVFAQPHEQLGGETVPSLLLQALGQGRSKYLIASSSAFAPASGNGESGPSRLIELFDEGLRSEQADLNEDGIITIEELYRFIEGKSGEREPDRKMFHKKYEMGSSQDLVVSGRRREGQREVPLTPEEKAFVEVIEGTCSQNKLIPFIGCGIYGGGPLSSFGLASALTSKAGLRSEERFEIATAAEYLLRYLPSRSDFLYHFKRILDEQSQKCEAKAIFEILSKMKQKALIISTTYDDLLERYLFDHCKKDGLIISHIVRSRDRKYDGQILLVHRCGPSSSFEIKLADEFLVEDADVIIYKLLGSPYLHDLVDAELEIDTVVVTEEDHAVFLGHLDNENTDVPTCLSPFFRPGTLLFLGYTLDAWHYRLVARILKKTDQWEKKKYAVRQANSPIEVVSWKGLNAQLAGMEPESFARALRACLEQGSPA